MPPPYAANSIIWRTPPLRLAKDTLSPGGRRGRIETIDSDR